MQASGGPALSAHLEEYEHQLPLLCPAPFDAIASVLALLQQRGLPVALVTGKSPESAAMCLTHFGFDTVFEVVESGSPMGVVKADAMRRIVSKWDVALHGST